MGELYKDRQYLEQLAADELLTQSEYISGRDLILTSYFQMIAFDHLKSFVFLFDPDFRRIHLRNHQQWHKIPRQQDRILEATKTYVHSVR